MLSNLLNNAAKYTPQPGTLVVAAERDGDSLIISVSDPGVGKAPEKQGSIFEMFSQLERSHEHGDTGLGIGLTLVKLLVGLHGGTISVQSDGRDRGSTFTVRLPLAADSGSVTERVDAPRPAGAMEPRRVLIVDDNAAAASLLAAIVEISGHEVRTAHDGERAIEVAAQYRPDVVLMDLGMPTMSGYEAAERIRREPWGAEMTLVALSGWGQEEHRRRTREAGFDEHIVKPISAETLERLLAAADRA